MPHIHELMDFTASAYIVHPTEPKICLLKHRRYGFWLQPGGHVELDEDPLQTLKHELEEEIGFKPDDYDIVELVPPPRHDNAKIKTLPTPASMNVHWVSDTHRHIDLVYIIRAKKTEFSPAPDESQEVEWLSIDEITALVDKSDAYATTRDQAEWTLQQVARM